MKRPAAGKTMKRQAAGKVKKKPAGAASPVDETLQAAWKLRHSQMYHAEKKKWFQVQTAKGSPIDALECKAHLKKILAAGKAKFVRHA